MEIQRYIDQKKEFHEHFLSYIDNDINEHNEMDKHNDFFEILRSKSNKEDLKDLFHFVLILSHNHNRRFDFYYKIEQIILYLQENI